MPTGLAATEQDLWVADWATGKVLQLIRGGEHLESPIEIASGLSQPEGLAVGAGGELYVVETGAGRVPKLHRSNDNGSATYIKTLIKNGLNKGISAAPNAPPTWIFSGIAVGGDGTLYVSDDVDSKILMIDP